MRTFSKKWKEVWEFIEAGQQRLIQESMKVMRNNGDGLSESLRKGRGGRLSQKM